jgi:hypothetical protein
MSFLAWNGLRLRAGTAVTLGVRRKVGLDVRQQGEGARPEATRLRAIKAENLGSRELV